MRSMFGFTGIVKQQTCNYSTNYKYWINAKVFADKTGLISHTV